MLQGFEWTNEGRGTKWGFVGNNVGDILSVTVPAADYRKGAFTIGLGFLISYQHMGVALLECTEGCTCRKKEYSSHHPNKVSVTSWRTVQATLTENSTACRVQVTIVEKSKSSPPEHKIKVSSVMTTEERDFILPYLYCDECLQ